MRSRLAVLAVALIAAACGGGAGGEPAATSASATSSTANQAPSSTVPNTSTAAAAVEATADVEALGDQVDLTAGSNSEVLPTGDVRAAAVGDRVQTDASGFAEVRFGDGSLTRLDVNTEFEILELAEGTAGGAVRTGFDAGRTWNRVERVAGSDQGFEVETSVATATVRGTAFVVWCFAPGQCRIMVVEGVVSVRTPDGDQVDVEAGEMIEVTAEGLGEVEQIPPDGAGAGEWIDRNIALDLVARFAQLPFQSILGGWSGTSEVIEDETGQSPVGTVREVGVLFGDACPGGNCGVHAQANIVGVGVRTSSTIWDGSQYVFTFEYPLEAAGCPFAYTVTWALRPVAGPNGIVVSFEGTDETVIVGLGDPASCFTGSATVVAMLNLGRGPSAG